MKDKEKERNTIGLSDILKDGIHSYTSEFGNLPKKHWKVINNIIHCRTAKLGGHIYKCDNKDCNYEHVSFNSCRDRHCPKCQGIARAAWVKKRMTELLPVGYFHVVFTIPDEFTGIDLKSKKVFYDVLFRSVAETLLTLGKDPRWLGAFVGFMAILHTWGQKLLDHPHIHCVIPGGGIRTDKKKWVSFRNNYLMPIEVMSQVFKGKFFDYFSQAVQNAEMNFSGPEQCCCTKEGFGKFIKEQRTKNWVVFAKKPFGSPEQVVKYLGRYTHRIAISNKRIVSQKDGRVTFQWKDYSDGNKQKLMEVSVAEFLRRYFLHVLPDGFVRIRYYGFLSNGSKTESLEKCFELLQKKYEKNEMNSKDIASIILNVLGIDITICPKCHTGHCRQHKEIMKPPNPRYRIAA